MSQIIMFIHTWSQTYTYDINLKASCCHDIHQFSKTTRQTCIHNTYIHTLNHQTMISYIYTHLCIDTVIWIQKRMQVAKNIHIYSYKHTYINTYTNTYIYIILYKCIWTRVVLTSFLISLSAPWLTRYSTISLCPL